MDFYRQILCNFAHFQENHEQGVGVATALSALLGHQLERDPNAGVGTALGATLDHPQQPDTQQVVQLPTEVGGLLNRRHSAGLEDVAQSWVGNGSNQPISPEELHRALGDEQVQHMATQSGMSKSQLLPLLVQVLPTVADRFTPHGRL